MRKTLPVLCGLSAPLLAAPALAQDSAEPNCELHVWAIRYVPPADGAAQSNALVRVTPANYADPHSSGSLLDPRQRLPEINAPEMLEHFGLSPDYKVVIHPEGYIAPKVFKKASTRMSDSASECYIDFALFGRTHTAGKGSFNYDWFFRDFGADDTEDLYVKGSNSGDLVRYKEEDKGIQTEAATNQIIMNAGRKITRRRKR
ncbi:MAG: hypothetical protein AAGA34_04550 [Pseudomonadota bacterium]